MIKRHPKFAKWMDGLADRRTRDRIAAGIAKLEFGIGDMVRLTDSALFELRLHFGPGYRVYFARRGEELIILLAGGDKSTQSKDIKTAEGRNEEV